MAEVEKNINDTAKITRHGDKQLTNLTLPSFFWISLAILLTILVRLSIQLIILSIESEGNEEKRKGVSSFPFLSLH
jgi:hypothetical protein